MEERVHTYRKREILSIGLLLLIAFGAPSLVWLTAFLLQQPSSEQNSAPVVLAVLGLIFGVTGLAMALTWRNERVVLTGSELRYRNLLGRERSCQVSEVREVKYKTRSNNGHHVTTAIATTDNETFKFSSHINQFYDLVEELEHAVRGSNAFCPNMALAPTDLSQSAVYLANKSGERSIVLVFGACSLAAFPLAFIVPWPAAVAQLSAPLLMMWSLVALGRQNRITVSPESVCRSYALRGSRQVRLSAIKSVKRTFFNGAQGWLVESEAEKFSLGSDDESERAAAHIAALVWQQTPI